MFQHLGILLEAGIVARRKEGLNAFYIIADRSVFDLCETVCGRLEEQFAARQDVLRGLLTK